MQTKKWAGSDSSDAYRNQSNRDHAPVFVDEFGASSSGFSFAGFQKVGYSGDDEHLI
ncbi:hypothetical protein MUG84_00950 [Paenibacillus sp. KQZ6P-2]|uniref:Uncharacterized protein n=1 Tax=Paenibacillus mangrovi TaxID=2931978 RepID=A0A9X2B3S4_9BACL|nr:hypothetical protein [Paenibacillus mangrovi]MCJ8010308.1 hypothetical protein [Paenibacillus mangrovi]